MRKTIKELKSFLLLWSTQSLSQLGSSMTSLALSVWLYEKTGSALLSAGLTISNYLPYVLVSIFAGALSDKWNKKKTMLVCDSLAGICTAIILVLIKLDLLEPWHMYVINAFNGFMNAFQQPASEVAMSVIIPSNHYQKTSGMMQFSRSLITILNPLIATSVYSLLGINSVCYIDLITFVIAFITLLFFIEINEPQRTNDTGNVFELIKEGANYLKTNKLILYIILFLSGINLVASAFDSVITPLVLCKTDNNERILGIVSSFSGIAMLFGSLIATVMKEPKDRAKVIYVSLFISMLLENFLIALSNNPIVWCIAQTFGWLPIPIFSTSYDVLFKTTIPKEYLGRVYSFRNSLQFFTIPIGNFVGGYMVDRIFEPFMAGKTNTIFNSLFGVGKGSGAAMSMFVLGIIGIVICLLFKDRIYDHE